MHLFKAKNNIFNREIDLFSCHFFFSKFCNKEFVLCSKSHFYITRGITNIRDFLSMWMQVSVWIVQFSLWWIERYKLYGFCLFGLWKEWQFPLNGPFSCWRIVRSLKTNKSYLEIIFPMSFSTHKSQLKIC